MNNNKNMSEMTVLTNRHFFYFTDLVLPLLLFVFTVMIFRFSNLDLTFQSVFYRQGFGWYLKDYPLFKILYHFGNIPALLLSVAGLVVVGLSFQKVKWVRWRKIGIFLALTMMIGPGLIINTALKDNWGRPRPRNTIEFGGKYSFEKVLSIDKTSPGYSFPCGHASMGFYLFIPWFILRKNKKGWARLSLILGIVYGLLIGLARIAQGGHYFSDVIIAGLVVYVLGAGLYYLLKLNISLWFYHKHEEISQNQRTIVTVIVTMFIIFLILGVVLATPYSKDKKFRSALSTQNPASLLDLNLARAELIIQSADSVLISCKTQGFGFPGSKIISDLNEYSSADTLKLHFSQIKKGFFTELDNTVKATYPFKNKSNLNVRLAKGNVSIFLPDNFDKLNLNIRIDKGSLRLMLPKGFKPKIKMKGDFKLNDNTGFSSSDSIFVKDDFKVNIIVVEGEVTLF